MKIIRLEQGSEDWANFRRGKISGTKIGKLFAKSRKKEDLFNTESANQTYYEVLAERLTVKDEESLTDAERGVALQEEAIETWCYKNNIDIDDVATDGVWQSEENENWICSPDAFENAEKPTWAVEVKCLNSANHLKAILTNTYPQDYMPQAINYFLVNPDLETLYFVMYDPRFISEKLHLAVFTIKRKDVKTLIERMALVRTEAEKQMEDIYKKYQ